MIVVSTIGLSIIVFLTFLLILKLVTTSDNDFVQKAVVEIEPHNKDRITDIKGRIYFTQTANGIHIKGKIEGLTPGLHGFHIHETGDLSQGCKSLKGHFNPLNKTHGARVNPDGKINKDRHLGDLGNIEANQKGVANIDFEDQLLSLNGKYTIVGRSIIVHQDPDDLGHGGTPDSLKTGSAGERIGCGVIGRLS